MIRSIAFTLGSLGARFTIHAMLNAYWEQLAFNSAAANGRRWRRWIDASANPR